VPCLLDTRAQPQDPQKVASAIRPDYSLGSHVAALGLAFSNPALGTGSWSLVFFVEWLPESRYGSGVRFPTRSRRIRERLWYS